VFGTGALKVTPAHDINDYNLGLKHSLAVIDTLNEDGPFPKPLKFSSEWTVLRRGRKWLKNSGSWSYPGKNYSTRLGFTAN
jgi:valyl-tRNA synthetase